MKPRTRIGALGIGCLLCIGWLLSAIAVAATPAASDGEQITQLLDQLGVRALIEQTPAIVAASTAAEMQFLQSTPPPANWQRDLETQLKPQTLLQNLTRYLHEHYRADLFRQAQQRLQEPLAKRARYFDLAMTQPGAEKNLREFLVQYKSEHSDSNANTPDERRALLREIDAASNASLLMATLQSAIAARVKQAAGQGAIDEALLKDEIIERQRYLEPLAVDYLLYDYRYLRDDELHDYRDLWRDEAVQALLDLCREAVLKTLMPPLTQQGRPQ